MTRYVIKGTRECTRLLPSSPETPPNKVETIHVSEDQTFFIGGRRHYRLVYGHGDHADFVVEEQ